MKWMSVAALVCLAAAPAQDDVKLYDAKAYGFQMNYFEGTKFEEYETTDGWGGVVADYDGVKLYGICKLGEDAKAADIEKFGVKLTGVGDEKWTFVEEGSDSRGWRWFRTVQTKHKGKVVYGGYGTGPAGSYILVITTTASDFDENKSYYEDWYRNVKLTELRAAPKGWEGYRAKDYNFSMFKPKGTTMKEKEWNNGWGGAYGEHEGVEFYGLAHMGRDHSADEIEKFGVKVTGLTADKWSTIDSGRKRRGCTWYRTVLAKDGGKVVFGIYGSGSKGSYLIVLRTDEKDFRRNRHQYNTWYASIAVK